MGKRKFNAFILLTSLGFIAAVAIGLFIFFQFRSLVSNYSNINKSLYYEYVDHLNKSVLTNASEYIIEHYPVLHDTALLKREAGTDWFWDLSSNFRELSKIFGFEYIYYVEKKGDNYIFLMSSGVQRDEHPEWLGGPVWKDRPPAFVEEAYYTKQVAFSREPTVNEWGTMISVARPVINDGNVVGVLGVDYNISIMDNLIKQELQIQGEEGNLMFRMRNILIISIVLIITFMGYQIWLSSTSTMVSLKDVEADERTRLMLESTPMICSLWDENYRIIDCDGESLKTYGLSSKSDFIKHYFDLNPEFQPTGESTRDAVMRIGREAAETGYKRFEWMSRTGEGEPLPLESTVVRVPWKKGYHYAVYSRDLREDKAKEAALQESENRLRIMVDTMAAACFFFDQSGNPIDCNQQAINLFRCHNKEEFLNNFFSYSPEFQPDGRQSREMVAAYMQRARDESRIVFLWHHVRPDGTLLPVEVTLVRVDWKDGYRIISYVRDLSELVETEDNLRRILATTEASPDFTIFLGPEGNIEYLNPAVSKDSGYSFEELNRDGLALLFSQEDYDRFKSEYVATALKKGPVDFEMILINKNGQKRDFSFSAFPVQMYDWSTGIGLLGRDITGQKQMQRDLAAAKEQAERALAAEVQYNQAKSDFLSKVSHELRTPLNSIIGLTDVAEKDSGKGRREIDRYIATIRESTQHLLSLINDILDMTGLDTGKFDFAPQPFSFRRALQPVIEIISQKAKDKRQIFTTTIDDQISDDLFSDERRLKQVLLNLLQNAVKFTPEEGKIELSAKCLKNDGKTCAIRFEVSDNGVGIPPEILQRIGQAFEQADNSISRQYGGLGLGLPLTKRIVSEMMNGHISVESEPGKGSRFICEVRLAIADAGVDKTGQAEESTEQVPQGLNLKGKRILIVDDVEINRDIIYAFLEDTGAELDTAGEGSDAVRLFSGSKYDLVLMDLHMPVMNGYIATKNIRTLPRPWANDTPIISVSAESSVELYAKCKEAGITDHLAKPVTIEALYKIIAKWLPGTGIFSGMSS